MSLEDKDLVLTPLKGESGRAFLGTYPDGQKVFIKLNTTPILAALAKEQIAPQLLWAKRREDGDMMSAQEWLDGRLLTKQDMGAKQVAQILSNLHKSRHLVNQLRQLDSKVQGPLDLLNQWDAQAPIQLKENSYLQSILNQLRSDLPDFDPDIATIVHGDVRHSNWIITTSGLIYLVDWDAVLITDRMYDVAHVLSHYIPRMGWEKWLTYYGYKYNEKVLRKVAWYGQLSYLMQILRLYNSRNMEAVNQEIYELRQFREGIS